MKPYSISRSYVHWLNGQRDVNGLTPQQLDLIKSAYTAGAQSMAGETLCILSDWAAACSGLEPESTTPSQVFDRAEENLQHYYTTLGVYNEV